MQEKEELVSIVVPVYNAEKFIKDTIDSVLNQTYKNWELLLIDDCSIDNSHEIIKKYIKKDNRINYFKLRKNSGPAVARNKGIEEAKGKYLCYLDADDKWDEHKLEKQINFMKKIKCDFSFTSYEFANKEGIPTGKKVFVPNKISYEQALKNTTIWTCTVMFDLTKISKQIILMPNVKSEDTASWWKILKYVDYAYGMPEVLSFYRRSERTLSSNKFVAIKRIWFLYRKVEKLNFLKSLYCFTCYAIHAVLRRI